MRSELLGYLLEALEPHEQRQLESELGTNDQLRDDLEVLRRGLICLEADNRHYDAPAGLAPARSIWCLSIAREHARTGRICRCRFTSAAIRSRGAGQSAFLAFRRHEHGRRYSRRRSGGRLPRN